MNRQRDESGTIQPGLILPVIAFATKMKSCEAVVTSGIECVWSRAIHCVAFICLATTAFGQSVRNVPPDPCSITKAGQVCAELATLVIRLQKSEYKQHEPIDVELVLRAGDRGVYLPDYFGDFMKTCEHGFSANLFTSDGKLAADAPTGCGGSWLFGNETAISELHNFVRLRPGETRTWHATLTTKTLKHGEYRVIAEYLSLT